MTSFSKAVTPPFFQKGASLNDGTDGFRFRFMGRDGLYRPRKFKRRYGLSKGKTFNALHMGRRTIHLERKKTERPLWNFSAL